MADRYITGKSGQLVLAAAGTAINAIVNTPLYSFGKWKAQLKGGTPKITNFTSGGFQALIAGISSATVSASGPYNSTNMALTLLTTYVWFLNFDTTYYIAVPAILNSIEADDDVEDAPRISISGESTGVFTVSLI